MSSQRSIDETFMRRAIRLAINARGHAEPNPTVGCVLVKDGRIIGEGWTQAYGQPHAEPTALAACTESPEGATVYCTLEPCSHVGKKTPPCAPRLVAAKVARVVVGTTDPNPLVNGRGIAALQSAGIAVTSGVLEADARQLIAPFITHIMHHRPYVTLKWAQSLDGKVAGPGGRRVAISNAASSRQVHLLRSRCDAILIGSGTALADDPLLTPRNVPLLRTPIRTVLDTHLRLPMDSQLVQTAKQVPLVVFTTIEQYDSPKAAQLRRMGAEVIAAPTTPNSHFIELSAVLKELYQRGVTHLLVEPGPTLAAEMMRQNLDDRLWVIRSEKAIDDASAPSAALVRGRTLVGRAEFEGDILSEYLNPASSVTFVYTQSPDLVLSRLR